MFYDDEPRKIESAPKNKRLLLWDPVMELWRIGSWFPDRFGTRDTSCWLYEREEYRFNHAYQPSHWLPLPDPIKES